MAKFAIIHGSFKHPDHSATVDKDGEPVPPKHPHAHKASGGFLGPSGNAAKPHVLELDLKEAERLDPGCTKEPWAGTCLKPLGLHGAELKGAAAGEAAKLEAMKAASAPAPSKKAG